MRGRERERERERVRKGRGGEKIDSKKLDRKIVVLNSRKLPDI